MRDVYVKTFEAAVRDPRAAAAAELRARSEESFVEFIKLMWPTVEPMQPLRVGWAFEAIAEHLEAVHNGQIRNLLINVPPGFSKSTQLNVFFPAWRWGPKKRPDLRTISWSYAEHLVVRDNEKCMTLIDSPTYQALWGGRFKWGRKKAVDFYKTDKEGFRIATGVKGVGTGERGDGLHIDDPISAGDAMSDAVRLFTNNWFNATLSSRVRNANPYVEVVEGVSVQPSSTIMIMQRLHHDDPSGIVIENELPDWEHLLIEMEYKGRLHPARNPKRESKKRPGQPAWRGSSIGYADPREELLAACDRLIEEWTSRAAERDAWWGEFEYAWLAIARDICTLADPVRYSRPAVEELRERLLLTVGGNAEAAQLDQWPTQGTGDMFPPEKWVYCEPGEVPPPLVMYDCRGWDLAASDSLTSDGTGAVKTRRGADKRFYVLHAERVRVGPGGVKDFRDRIRMMDGPTCVQDFPQDPGQAGVDQVRAIVQEAPGTPTFSSTETGPKTTRAMPASGFQNKGLVVLVRGAWNAEFVKELGDFPYSKMSALVDAFSRSFNRLATMHVTGAVGGTGIVLPPTRAESIAATITDGPRLNPAIHRPEVDDEYDEDID